MNTGYYRLYLEYIANAGGKPTIAHFDEDWQPLGPTLRADMVRLGLVEEVDGSIIAKL
jgi:hypothetical protein